MKLLCFEIRYIGWPWNSLYKECEKLIVAGYFVDSIRLYREERMKITELGCAGHFIGARNCAFRRHTQVGKRFRISTVGEYHPKENGPRETIGAGENSFFETYVFKTTGKPCEDSEDCGCMEVADWSEIDGSRWATAGEAQKGHEAFVKKYANLSARH